MKRLRHLLLAPLRWLFDVPVQVRPDEHECIEYYYAHRTTATPWRELQGWQRDAWRAEYRDE